MAAFQYEKLKSKYGDFTYPMMSLSIGGKSFSENKKSLVVSDLSLDLSVGMEASVAVFSLYNVYNEEEGEYTFSDFKSYVLLGSSVSISLGYADQLTEVFQGFVSQVLFTDQYGQMHHVEVTASDVKGLMMSNACARQMASSNYGDAVKEIFQKQIYQQMSSNGIYQKVQVSQTPDKDSQSGQEETAYTVEMVSESDYEFVVKAARRFNFEFFVENGVVTFRKAKETKEDCLMELGSGEGIRSYSISYDITGIVKKVEVRGMDTARGTMVSAKKSVSNKISTGNRAKSLINQTERVVIDANAITKEQAQCRADSMMEEISYRFGLLECECIGMPELMPGHFIRTKGMGGPCDNLFYITNVKHTLDDEKGYRSFITAKAAALT